MQQSPAAISNSCLCIRTVTQRQLSLGHHRCQSDILALGRDLPQGLCRELSFVLMEISLSLTSVQASWNCLWHPGIVLDAFKRSLRCPQLWLAMVDQQRNDSNRNEPVDHHDRA